MKPRHNTRVFEVTYSTRHFQDSTCVVVATDAVRAIAMAGSRFTDEDDQFIVHSVAPLTPRIDEIDDDID